MGYLLVISALCPVACPTAISAIVCNYICGWFGDFLGRHIASMAVVNIVVDMVFFSGYPGTFRAFWLLIC